MRFNQGIGLGFFTQLLSWLLLLYPGQPSYSYPIIGGAQATGMRRLVRMERLDSAELVKTL
ncbi:MAG: hypothetical protein HC821_04205, partial [Lewinella sp.]|nr:hypothetical protein [Lewinella sp.]